MIMIMIGIRMLSARYYDDDTRMRAFDTNGDGMVAWNEVERAAVSWEDRHGEVS